MVDNLLGVYVDVITPIFELLAAENYEETLPKTIEKIKAKLELM